MPRLIYTLVIIALLPWAIVHLLWRARRQPEYLHHWVSDSAYSLPRNHYPQYGFMPFLLAKPVPRNRW